MKRSKNNPHSKLIQNKLWKNQKSNGTIMIFSMNKFLRFFPEETKKNASKNVIVCSLKLTKSPHSKTLESKLARREKKVEKKNSAEEDKINVLLRCY